MHTRRELLKFLFLSGTTSFADVNFGYSFKQPVLKSEELKKIKIDFVNSNFEREPLLKPFGFKGGYITELWQSASFLRASSGISKVGLATQSILWSDPSVYSMHSESGGNALMYAITEYALQLLKGHTFEDPIALQHEILPEVYEYGKRITGHSRLRKTFVLNALVGLDNAIWMLYAAENNLRTFDEMIPSIYRPALSFHQKKVAGIPLISYNTDIAEVKEIAKAGYFFLKIKIGQPGSQSDMLSKDMEWLSAIHKAIGHLTTAHTASGKLSYYLDANGRYERKETLFRLLEHLRKIGALDQVVVIEEPFAEDAPIDVSDLPVRIAADESAHTDKDVKERIEMGYRAIALKPIAKTLSMTMKMTKAARENNIPCFCADLTVNPVLVDWNKNIAARLNPFPNLSTGLLETNGPQNYKNWSIMKSYLPYPDASWVNPEKGIFNLDHGFYEKSGGVLTDSKHYMEAFNHSLK